MYNICKMQHLPVKKSEGNVKRRKLLLGYCRLFFFFTLNFL